MRVIGTAGHVDHGKSTLVQALTGINPDRLKEEREREMTIDLGFAWMTLPIGEDGEEEIGIVDVPGHRDFIENMLAGIGGIDAALFVVAADEGVMPQTREHLAILDLLQIHGGVIALTKVDLIDDSEWLDLVEADVVSAFQDTVLGNAPIIRVSATQRRGLDELKNALSEALKQSPPRPDLGRPRLPVDRVFTISGFGTVVTGTLTDGSLQTGEEIEILPSGKRGRIRGLQSHKRKENIAFPGSRTAVNITGVNKDEIQRGDVIIHPGDYKTTRRMDVRFRLLKDASSGLQHNISTKLFIGAAEVLARVRLLGVDELKPGENGWLQLELSDPVVAVRGDRFILRRPSPGETLGGGRIIDPHPKGRHKRFAKEIITRLEALAKGTPADVLHQALIASGFSSLKEVGVRSNLPESEIMEAIKELLKQGKIVNLDNPSAESINEMKSNHLVTSRERWEQLCTLALHSISEYHKVNPLRKGLPREELKSRLNKQTQGSAQVFNGLIHYLVDKGELVESSSLLHLPDHQIRFTEEQQKLVDALLAQFTQSPYSPPTIKESKAALGDELVYALIELGELIAVDTEVAFRKTDYYRMVQEIQSLIEKNGSISVAQVRDHFKTSRRYALALLEHLDSIGITKRQGDVRVLREKGANKINAH